MIIIFDAETLLANIPLDTLLLLTSIATLDINFV